MDGRRKKLRDCLIDTLGIGQFAAKIERAARERGDPIPDSAAERPEVREDYVLAWEAFSRLSASRQIHMGVVGRIPFEAVDAYARRIGMTAADEFEDFLSAIETLDTAYVEHCNKA